MTEEKKAESHENDHGHAHAAPKRPMRNRFTAQLLQWAAERRPVAEKPAKEMTEDERKARSTRRNRRRRRKAKEAEAARAIAKGLGKRPPKPNTCRRRRLAARHPERKGGRK